jgi:hypothetical protein
MGQGVHGSVHFGLILLDFSTPVGSTTCAGTCRAFQSKVLIQSGSYILWLRVDWFCGTKIKFPKEIKDLFTFGFTRS